jgi:hypothetical protein
MFFDLDKQADKDVDAIRAFTLTKTNKDAPAPVDDWTPYLTDKPYQVMTDAELMQLPAGSTMLLDIECYENYFLVAFKSLVNGKVLKFEQSDSVDMIGCSGAPGMCDGVCPGDCLRPMYIDYPKMAWVMQQFTTVGFGSRDYDVPLLRVALQGYGCKFLKGVSNWIVYDEVRLYEVEKRYNLINVQWNHVDLIEVAPLKGSLKLYAGRLHCQRMQDLPYEHDAILSIYEIEKLSQYCINDLDNTELLMMELGPQLGLRSVLSYDYGIDLRSRSDAQIAEYVIVSELLKMSGKKAERPSIPPGKIYYYTPPKYIKYRSQVLREMLDVVRAAKFVVDESGKINMPDELAKMKIKIGQCTYQMGIGGLHSTEKSVCHFAGEEYMLLDRDVASYYPAIILNGKLAPKHLGSAFLTVYQTLVDRRLHAKKQSKLCKEQGRLVEAKAWEVIADSLKITINGCFGKLGNRWSSLYAPDLLIQVTITGQLALLLLIDMLESAGIAVVSANTDGVLIKPRKEQKPLVDDIIKQWEADTGFTTEEKQFKAVYSRDINNYIAIPFEGETKVKGAYSERGSAGNSSLSRNPECFVCVDAVIAFLSNGADISQTIRSCTDVRRFLVVRNVKGGAEKSSQYVGKTVRWYYSVNMQGEINYRTTGNKVPNSDGAMPMMELASQLPTDLDFDRYVLIAENMLIDLGAKPKPPKKGGQGRCGF